MGKAASSRLAYLLILDADEIQPNQAATLASSPCPGSCSQIGLLGHRAKHLSASQIDEVSPGSRPVEPALCKLSCNFRGTKTDSLSIYTPCDTHTYRMRLASEAADAGFIPSLFASD